MIKLKLSLMMLLQYMMYAVWWVPLAAYLTNLDVSSFEKSMILSSMAIGCIVSPVIGMLADRFFPGQKVLASLNLLNAVMLLLAGTTNQPDLLFIFLLIAMLGYMPSWSLTSSIAMAHIPSEQFPKIRVFGSIGWVASGIFSVIFIRFLGFDFDGTNIPFYCGAAVSIVAVFVNLTLPNTPPPAKGQKGSLIDAFGLRTVELMRDKNFAIFIAFSFLSMIPFAMYYSFFSEFLLNINTKYISITMNWGVLAEMGFLLLVPLAIKKLGLRKVMIFGLIALTIRYFSFYAGGVINQSWMYFIGILIHGLIFGFFYVGGQIYIDKKAPAELKSQAQGFIFLVTFGAGLLVGNFICSELIANFKSDAGYNWNAIWGITTLSSVVLVVAFMLLFKNNDEHLKSR
ncbi:nucleoside transporter [Draconibacterium orientale]|uniref:Major facilitator transporter n=1 Tax=Draconibacterium orientale TaxID=1168034 RepID=X5DJV3_9BACT|nr:MFS transporter [Draconibacterium orientale]AHW60792.1 major facilitator transporter [Draconibacterium orientale]SES69519.1 nucleoside transporter [Draconibacterium orientale]